MVSPTFSKRSSYIMNVTGLENVCNAILNSSIRLIDCAAAQRTPKD